MGFLKVAYMESLKQLFLFLKQMNDLLNALLYDSYTAVRFQSNCINVPQIIQDFDYH